MQKVTLGNLNLLPNRLVITEKLFIGFSLIVCLTIDIWLLIATFQTLTVGLHQTRVWMCHAGLLAVPRLLVIFTFRTSLVVSGCRSLAVYVLETVHLAGRFGTDRRLRCLIVSIHASRFSVLLFFFFRTVCVKSYE